MFAKFALTARFCAKGAARSSVTPPTLPRETLFWKNWLDSLLSFFVVIPRITGLEGVVVNLGGTRFALVVAVAALSACETVPPDVSIKPVTATVSNFSGKTINSINYQPCDLTGSWLSVGVGSIASGTSTTFDIPAPCVNLQAFYADGKLAGSQSGVRRDFPFSWVIR